MKAAIINIGDELLIGQVVNTNASWMAEVLKNSGVQIEEVVVISDKKESI